MTKKDDIQTAINQASLMLPLAEDCARAVKKAELHPEFAVVFMRMHSAVHQLQKDMQESRQIALRMAQTINIMAERHAEIAVIEEEMMKRLSLSKESIFGPEDKEPH